MLSNLYYITNNPLKTKLKLKLNSLPSARAITIEQIVIKEYNILNTKGKYSPPNGNV